MICTELQSDDCCQHISIQIFLQARYCFCHWTSCVETLQVHIYVGPSKVLEFFQFLKPIYKGLESPLKQTGSMKFLGKRCKDPWKSLNLSFISHAFRTFAVRTLLANSVIQQFVMDYLCSKCCCLLLLPGMGYAWMRFLVKFLCYCLVKSHHFLILLNARQVIIVVQKNL